MTNIAEKEAKLRAEKREIILKASYDEVRDGFYNLISLDGHLFRDFVMFLEAEGSYERVREYMTEKMLDDCTLEDIKEEF